MRRKLRYISVYPLITQTHIPQKWPTVDSREQIKDKGGGGDEKEEAEKKTDPDREKGTQETMKRGKGGHGRVLNRLCGESVLGEGCQTKIQDTQLNVNFKKHQIIFSISMSHATLGTYLN